MMKKSFYSLLIAASGVNNVQGMKFNESQQQDFNIKNNPKMVMQFVQKVVEQIPLEIIFDQDKDLVQKCQGFKNFIKNSPYINMLSEVIKGMKNEKLPEFKEIFKGINNPEFKKMFGGMKDKEWDIESMINEIFSGDKDLIQIIDEQLNNLIKMANSEEVISLNFILNDQILKNNLQSICKKSNISFREIVSCFTIAESTLKKNINALNNHYYKNMEIIHDDKTSAIHIKLLSKIDDTMFKNIIIALVFANKKEIKISTISDEIMDICHIFLALSLSFTPHKQILDLTGVSSDVFRNADQIETLLRQFLMQINVMLASKEFVSSDNISNQEVLRIPCELNNLHFDQLIKKITAIRTGDKLGYFFDDKDCLSIFSLDNNQKKVYKNYTWKVQLVNQNRPSKSKFNEGEKLFKPYDKNNKPIANPFEKYSFNTKTEEKKNWNLPNTNVFNSKTETKQETNTYQNSYVKSQVTSTVTNTKITMDIKAPNTKRRG